MEVKQVDLFTQNQILNMVKGCNAEQKALHDIQKEKKKIALEEDEEGEQKEQMIYGNCCNLVLLIFGIIYLIEDYELCKKCGGSSLWAYVLTTLIISTCCGSNDYKKYKSQKSVLVILTFIFFINTSMCIWGGSELWGKSCESLTGSSIWIFGCILFIFQLITSLICWWCIRSYIYLIFFTETEDGQSSTKDGQNLTNIV